MKGNSTTYSIASWYTSPYILVINQSNRIRTPRHKFSPPRQQPPAGRLINNAGNPKHHRKQIKNKQHRTAKKSIVEESLCNHHFTFSGDYGVGGDLFAEEVELNNKTQIIKFVLYMFAVISMEVFDTCPYLIIWHQIFRIWKPLPNSTGSNPEVIIPHKAADLAI